MRRELLIAAGPGEWRAAWLEDGSAVELHVERGDRRPTGSIHVGRVVRLIGGLDAALVDIGEERPGFLPLRGGVDEGARIVVQVRREAQRGKGALLSTRLAAANPDHLAARAASLDPPAQLEPPPGFAAALAQRLPGVPDRVLADDPAIVPELRSAFGRADVDHCAAADWPVDLDALFDAALTQTLALPGGGLLHIQETETAVLFDVDTGSPESGSGGRAALETNLAAAIGIARQVRLRQLGGAVVIDFAAVEGRRARERIQAAIAAAMAGDPAEPRVLGWTRLGHLELVRPRRGRSISEAILEMHPARKSAVAVAYESLRALGREARASPATNWRLAVGPEVAAALRGPAAAALRGLEARLGRPIAIDVATEASRGFDIVPR